MCIRDSMHADAKTVAGWDRALDEIMELVKKRTGYVSLWWCVAKWDHLTDGRSQATDPHPVPWRAYPPAVLEFMWRNPARLWRRGPVSYTHLTLPTILRV